MQRGFVLLMTLALALGAIVPLIAPAPTRAAPTDLFFSEYVDGTGQNQAVEIFNGTGAAIDLDAGDYNVQIYFQGSAFAGVTIELTGVVAPGDVHVLSNSAAHATVLAQSDQTAFVSWFDGDDAVALVRGTTALDVIGQTGVDPGSQWGTDPTSTADNTLRRIGTIEAGDPNGTDPFVPGSEWYGLANDTFDGLGSHALLAPPPDDPAVFINEIHYDNAGADVGEGVEVTGPAGIDLSGWSLVPYNGANGLQYNPVISLVGTIPDQQNGFGALNFAIAGLQNGSPDGVALVNGTEIVQFLSYEGGFAAANGPAVGLPSTDIGVSQSGSDPIGLTLQLQGTGTTYADFAWAGPIAGTPGGVNTGQAFGEGANAPVTADCGGPLALSEGSQGESLVTATDPDGIVTQLSISNITPADPGTISIGDTTPAIGPGGEASATVLVGDQTPVDPYQVEITATNSDASVPQTATCTLTVSVFEVLTIGEVQGSVADTDDGTSHRSPYAPPSGNGNGETVAVRGVVTQLVHFRAFDFFIDDFNTRRGFFLQSTLDTATSADTADGDPDSSDGILVFQNFFEDLRVNGGGFYEPQVGDELVLRGPIVEFFNLTQLASPFVFDIVREGVDLETEIEWTEANPSSDLGDANRFWERHEGMQLVVPAGAQVTASRDVFGSTADGEMWVIHPDHALLDRADPFAQRVFRDPHPLDDIAELLFDNGNGHRIMLQSHGLKALAGDNTLLIDPSRTFDTVTNELRGGLYFAFDKYGIEVTEQPAHEHGVDPSLNAPPAEPDREIEYSTAVYNVENLYDFRDDPFDGCDFEGNDGCTGVDPPFDYVPSSDAAYQAQLADLADQIATDLHGPDILLIQEAEDQDICTVNAGALVCGDADNADGKPDTLQELALVIEATHGIRYDAAYDRDGADDRGIVNGFLYRTDRVELVDADTSHPVLGSDPQIEYRSGGLDYNVHVQNPKALNAELPPDVDTSTGQDGDDVFTRSPQVGSFRVWRDGIGASVFTDLYAISNHFSSGPDGRVGQRTEQAAYNAAIVEALSLADDGDRVVVGGDFNVFPRPDDPFAPRDSLFPSDQLAALYEIGLFDLWVLVAKEAPASAYSYVFDGQAQTLDDQFTTDLLFDELNDVRFAHINADYPADFGGDGSRGSSDHDPQAARFDGATVDALINLVEYLLEAGSIDPSKADQLLERLGRVAGLAEDGSTSAAQAQLRGFGNQVDGLSPQWIDADAAAILQLEAEVLGSDL
jgi:predicted extracellular nuclease